jgi:hypothetical protein
VTPWARRCPLLGGPALAYISRMKTLLRPLAALVALGLGLVLVPTAATGGGDCVSKCKDAQASCDQTCDQNKLVCIGKCGGPLGGQKCSDDCNTARSDCGNTCLVNEKVCEAKCASPVPLP